MTASKNKVIKKVFSLFPRGETAAEIKKAIRTLPSMNMLQYLKIATILFILDTCYNFPQPEGGQISYSPVNGGAPYPIGTVASLVCEKGFVSNGSTFTNCQSTGWSPSSLGQCKQGRFSIKHVPYTKFKCELKMSLQNTTAIQMVLASNQKLKFR